jgi:hypothetical protein
MRKAHVSLYACIAAATILTGPSTAVAGQDRPVTPMSPAEVQKLSDELARLKREFETIRRQYDDRLLALEQRLAQIGGPVATAPQEPPPPPPVQAPATPAQPQPAPGSSKVFNPDISVNGNFIAAGGKNELAPLPPLQLSEVEAAFQAIVDPYAKADFFISAGAEGASVEEGFITFTALPANLLLKAGRMRAQFGKVNTLHTHGLPTADRPLVTQNLVGGDEGFTDEGVSLSHLVDIPNLFLEFTGEVYRGASDVFLSDSRTELAYLGRARAYRDITESTNIDVGASFAFGRAPVPGEIPDAFSSHDRRLIGIDATFRYRPLRRAIYQRLNLRTELIWNRQDLPEDLMAKSFGFYALGEYQFARRWYLGGRVDRSGRALDAEAIDRGGSAFLTFWPTEFSQVRGQYRFTSFAEGAKAHEFLFQLNFSIGAHGAHVF